MIIDYSTSRPPITLLRTAGVTAVGRYIGWDSVPGFSSIGKNITAAEAHELINAGIAIFLAFEYTADAAAQGAPQGTKDGQLAKTQLAEIQAPPDMGVYFAVDFDIPDYAPHLLDTPANAMAKLGPVGQYFQAINNLRYAYEIDAYGGYWAIKRLLDAGLIRRGWQTIAWSGGHLDPRAVLYQVVASSPIVGADVDIREHVTTSVDFGQWPRPVKPTPPPVTNPTPAPTPIPQEPDVSFPMVLNLEPGHPVVLPVPSSKTKVVLYADSGATQGGMAPTLRVGSGGSHWEMTSLSPTWDAPAVWAFPSGTNRLTVMRTDAGSTVVTADFA